MVQKTQVSTSIEGVDSYSSLYYQCSTERPHTHTAEGPGLLTTFIYIFYFCNEAPLSLRTGLYLSVFHF